MAEPVPSETRVTLLHRLRREPGNERAWGEFVEHYGGRVLAWCRAWGLQDADAHDVAQDILLQLAVQMRDFAYDPQRSFHAWLKTVARRAWAAFLERGKRPGRGSGDSRVLEQLSSV